MLQPRPSGSGARRRAGPIYGSALPGPGPAGIAGGRGEIRDRGRERGGRGVYREIRPVHAAELLRPRVYVHESAGRVGDVDEGVPARGDLPEPAAESDQQITPPETVRNPGVDPDAGMAAIVRVAVVDVVLAAE